MGGFRFRFSTLCISGAVAYASARGHEVELVASAPYCRKSPEVHQLHWPDREDADKLVIFGGKGFEWQFTHDGHGRKAREVLDSRPSNREDVIHRMIDDGYIEPHVSFFGDIWAFDSKTGRWTQIGLAGPSPVARWKPSTTTADGGRTMILFGGCQGTEVTGILNDLWTFTVLPGEPLRALWTQVFTANPPPKRRGHITATNKTHLIIVGGKSYTEDTGTVVLADVWATPLATLGLGDAFSPASGVWTRGQDFPGTPRWGATGEIVKKSNGDEVLLTFGGRRYDEEATADSGESVYVYYGELWMYDLKANSWSLLQPKGAAPHKRDHHGATVIKGDYYVFGGRVSPTRDADSDLNDLWSFSLRTMTWTRHEPARQSPMPAPRFMPGFTATMWEGEEVPTVFGGESLPGSTKTASRNDVWVFVPARHGGHEWKQLWDNKCEPDSVEVREAAEETFLDAVEAPGTWYPAAAAAVAILAVGAVASTSSWRSASRDAVSGEEPFLVSERGQYVPPMVAYHALS